MDIQILPVNETKQPVKDESNLVFGKEFTNRMFVMEYDTGKGWHSPRIEQYGPFSLDPAALVLHYAQEIFEGLKAFRRSDGEIALFRPRDNFERFNHSMLTFASKHSMNYSNLSRIGFLTVKEQVYISDQR